jgi:hypothetical protein
MGYDGPRWRTGVFDGKDWDGSRDDWPWRWSLLRSGASRGICAIVMFIVVFVGIFVRPRRRAQSRGRIGSGVGIDIAWGFGCVVVVVAFVTLCGGRWWDARCDVVI